MVASGQNGINKTANKQINPTGNKRGLVFSFGRLRQRVISVVRYNKIGEVTNEF